MGYVVPVAIVVALVGIIAYAAYADWTARKSGKVIVPVKHGFGKRTTFERVDREELDLQKAEMILAKQRKEKAERAEFDGQLPNAFSRLRKKQRSR